MEEIFFYFLVLSIDSERLITKPTYNIEIFIIKSKALIYIILI